MTIFKAIEMENYKDEPLQFVGVYVLRWRPEWGKPSMGFVEDDETIAYIERLQRIEEAAQKVVEGWNKGGIAGAPDVIEMQRRMLAFAAALEEK